LVARGSSVSRCREAGPFIPYLTLLWAVGRVHHGREKVVVQRKELYPWGSAMGIPNERPRLPDKIQMPGSILNFRKTVIFPPMIHTYNKAICCLFKMQM
jgi:hypothetical protein